MRINVEVEYDKKLIRMCAENSSRELFINLYNLNNKNIGKIIAAYLEDVANDDLDKYKDKSE